MRIYLIQHGEAVAEEKDPERPLTDKGMDDVRRISMFLADAAITVERIIHSGKLRAQQTANILAELLLERGDVEESDGIKPNDSVEKFRQTMIELQQDTMIVSHLPFLSRLVTFIINHNTDNTIVTFHPGTVVCLERATDNTWSIIGMLRPEWLLPD